MSLEEVPEGDISTRDWDVFRTVEAAWMRLSSWASSGDDWKETDKLEMFMVMMLTGSTNVDGFSVTSYPKSRVELGRLPLGGVSSCTGGFLLLLSLSGTGGLFLLLPFETFFLCLEQTGCLCFCLEVSELKDGENAGGVFLADGGSVTVMVAMVTKVVSTKR